MKYLLALLLIFGVAAILFPVFARGKVPDHTPRCLSIVKVNATAMIIYQADWDDRFPLRDSWQDAARNYLNTDRYDRCPLLQKEKPNAQIFGFALNKELAGQRTPKNSQGFPLVFDSINLARNASGTIESLPLPGRHEGTNNIAYTDGSAKAVRTN